MPPRELITLVCRPAGLIGPRSVCTKFKWRENVCVSPHNLGAFLSGHNVLLGGQFLLPVGGVVITGQRVHACRKEGKGHG